MNIKSVLTAMACLSIFSFAQLPTLTIKTKNNAMPVATQVQNGQQYCPAGTSSGGFGQTGGDYSTSGAMGYIEKYIETTETEVTGSPDYNFKRTAPGIANASDSIRIRGNSTAATNVNKKSFRIKFDKKVAMFGRPATKSWALLANYYDPSIMQSYLAFYLGRKLKLDFTPNGYYLKLNVANQNRGVYLLTDQIQRSEASVNIDKEGGWLVEFDYHCATSTDDQQRYYHTGSSRYNLNTKIREPDLDDLPQTSSQQPDGTCLDFVKSDINALLDKMKDSNFPNNGYRDYVDLESYAKYIMVQLFMDNQDWNGMASNSTLLGSTYAYRNKGEKIKAGPLWDFDLACGSSSLSGSFFNKDINEQMEPRHDYYKRLFDDPVFRAKYKKIWNDNKSVFEHVKNNVVDSITNYVASSMAGNIANGVSNVTEQSYKEHTAKLKDWLGRRITAFGNYVNSMSNVGNDVAESAVASALLNSKMVCKNAVSSSSAANISSSSENNGQITLSCGPVQSSVEKGGTIAVPDLICSNGVAATDTVWNGRGSTGWSVRPETQTQSYTISVTATCGSQRNLQAQCGTVIVGATTPIIGNAIMLENLPSSAKIEIYNLQGKLVYSTYSENSKIPQIPVQTKGVYIIRVKQGNSTSTYQNRIYLN